MNFEAFFVFKELCLSSFKFRLLVVDGDRQELTLETTLGDSEVDTADKGRAVGRDLHKLITSGHIESESRVVINSLLTNLDYLSRSLLKEVFSEDRDEERLNAINFLDDQYFTESNGQFNVGVELGVLVVEDFNVVAGLLERVLHPFRGLSSWVDNKRSLDRVHNHDSVLHGQAVSREAFFLPGEHLLL